MVEERSMINILVLWRGQQLNVEMNLDSTVEEFGLKLQKLTNVKPDTLQLIVPRSTNRSSKLLTPFSNEHSKLTLKEISILEGKPIRMMGVFADEIEEVSQNSVKPDLRIAGFEEEDKRLRQRMLGAPQTLTIPQGPYIFSEFRTLQIPGIELNPPASEALRRMHMLASDPGIVAIMNKHRWRVGMMTELAPVGYVGISPKCILGFNKNHGEEISLRLRTDDLKGFRKYESIKKTLLHELAHMVYSEHDASFFALDKELNKEAASLDWTKAKSYSLSGLKFSNHDNEEFNVGTSHYAQKLGGKTLDSFVDARASAVAAAYRRSSNASTNSSGDVQVCGESKKSHDILNHEHPEATRYAIHEPDPDDGELGCEEKRNNDHKTSVEPDPDDCQENNDITEYQSIFERYPNDSQVKKTVHVETSMEIDRSCSYDQCDEPDPDDCQSDENKVECGKGSDHNPDDSQEGEFMKCETYSKINDGKLFLHKVILKNKNRLEPDPDDFEASKNILECGNMSEPDADESRSNTVLLEYENMEEPDPDDSEASMDKLKSKPREKLILEKAFQEPDPDDCGTKMAIFKHGITFEPDPDDSKENKTMQAEPDPDDCGSKVAILKYGNTFEPDPDDSKENKTMQAEPDPDEVVEKLLSFPISENSDMKIDESDPDDVAERPSSSACKKMSEDSWPVSGLSSDDRELQRIQDSVSVICSRLQKSIEMLRTEATPTEATSVLATLSKIIRNVIEHPDELKFRRLRKGNPAFQRNVANYKAAMEVLEAVGFYEDVLYDGIGKSEAYLVLKRNDPALLWLAKSSLEICSTA